jgi:hypothetical protein
MTKKRIEYYYTRPREGEENRRIYNINLGYVSIDKEIFDRMLARFGQKKVMQMVKSRLISSMDEIYCLLRPYPPDIEKYGGIDGFINHYTSYEDGLLSFEGEDQDE